MSELSERRGQRVHLVSEEGSVEKHACFFSTWLRIDRRRGDVACLAWYLEGRPSGEASFRPGFCEDGTLSCPYASFPVAGLPS